MLNSLEFHSQKWVLPLEDKSFIRRVLEEDPGAVDTLESWIRSAAFPYRSRLASQWEDLLQEIRLEAFQLFRDGGLEGKTNLKSYIWTMVNHTCIDHLRKNATWRFTTLEALPPESGVHQDPLAGIRRNNRMRGLLYVLGKVPQDCRDLWRQILAGQSYRQIADSFNISEATLRVRVYRCRKRATELRQQLEV